MCCLNPPERSGERQSLLFGGQQQQKPQWRAEVSTEVPRRAPGVVPGSGIGHHLQTQPASLQIGRANPPLFSEREQLRPIGGGI